MRSSVDPILTPSFDQKKETIKLKKKKVYLIRKENQKIADFQESWSLSWALSLVIHFSSLVLFTSTHI